MSQVEKVIDFLDDGREATTKELANRFKIANVRAVIDSARKALKRDRLYVYSNRRDSRNGSVNKYRIGTISKALYFGRSADEWFSA